MKNLEVYTAPSNLINRIPVEEITSTSKEGLMLYSTNKSATFCPLFMWKNEENIMVIPQESLQEDLLASLFGDEDVTPVATYAFPEAELLALVGDEPELLCDVVAFLENHQEHGAQELLGLLTDLKNEGFSLISILVTMHSLSKNELSQMFFIHNEMKTFLRGYFTKLFCNQNNTEEEEE